MRLEVAPEKTTSDRHTIVATKRVVRRMGVIYVTPGSGFDRVVGSRSLIKLTAAIIFVLVLRSLLTVQAGRKTVADSNW